MRESVPATKDIEVTWHALSREEVLKKLDSDIEKGLTSEQAQTAFRKIWPKPARGRKKNYFLADDI